MFKYQGVKLLFHVAGYSRYKRMRNSCEGYQNDYSHFSSVSAAKIGMRLLVVLASCYPKWSFNKGVVKTMLSYGSECEYNTVCIQIAISFSLLNE